MKCLSTRLRFYELRFYRTEPDRTSLRSSPIPIPIGAVTTVVCPVFQSAGIIENVRRRTGWKRPEGQEVSGFVVSVAVSDESPIGVGSVIHRFVKGGDASDGGRQIHLIDLPNTEGNVYVNDED